MGEPELKRMTADEFLDWQQHQEFKYELVDGLPLAPLKSLHGVTHDHDRIKINLIASLATQLRGTRWSVATGNIVLLMPDGDVRRADALVQAAAVDLNGMSAVEPRMAIEVLSPSTMNFDRFRKLDEYRTIPSLAYILLVDTEKPQLTLHVREGDFWRPQSHSDLDVVLDLPTIECTLAARDIFEGLPFAE